MPTPHQRTCLAACCCLRLYSAANASCRSPLMPVNMRMRARTHACVRACRSARHQNCQPGRVTALHSTRTRGAIASRTDAGPAAAR
eukprot:366565-Chlamydomonas_euryale.AAC.17